MKIEKIHHSCLVIEEKGERLLIDPGGFAFKPISDIDPKDIGEFDVMLITHAHGDHFSRDAVRTIIAKKKPRIVTHKELHELLKKEGIESKILKEENIVEVGNFKLEGVTAPHADIYSPNPIPHNMGFLINNTLFHPGDSFDFHLESPPKVFALPTVAPWLTRKQAFEVGAKLKPEIIVPIHDGMVKEFFRKSGNDHAKQYFEEHNIEFNPLNEPLDLTTPLLS